MTLFERAQRIAERASNLGNTEEIQQQVDELAAKHDVLKEKLQQLTAATQHASVLRKNNCLDKDPLPVNERISVSNRLAQVRTNFDLDPATIAQGRDFTLLLKGLERLTKTSRQAVENAWNNWFETKYPNYSESLLNTVGTVLPEKQATVVAIRAHLDALENNRNDPPRDQSTWDDFERHCHEAQDKYTKLVADFPEHVRDFCIDAADPAQGAQMFLLTPDVERWLRQHHLWDALKIHLK